MGDLMSSIPDQLLIIRFRGAKIQPEVYYISILRVSTTDVQITSLMHFHGKANWNYDNDPQLN